MTPERIVDSPLTRYHFSLRKEYLAYIATFGNLYELGIRPAD